MCQSALLIHRCAFNTASRSQAEGVEIHRSILQGLNFLLAPSVCTQVSFLHPGASYLSLHSGVKEHNTVLCVRGNKRELGLSSTWLRSALHTAELALPIGDTLVAPGVP